MPTVGNMSFIFDHLQFYLIGSAICTALAAIIYIPLMWRASRSQKVVRSTAVLAVCGLIFWTNWGASFSYNSSVPGAAALAFVAMLTIGWIGCVIVDVILQLLSSFSGKN